MMLDRFDELMILVFSVWFLAVGSLFAMVWQTSRRSMIGKHRTRLSKAQHDLAAGLVTVFLSIGTAYAFRWIAGPEDGATWAHPPFRIGVRLLLIVGMVISTWAGVRVVGALLDRSRNSSSGIGISQERILATVAVDLPMIVSDQDGVIRYATEPMEELALAKPGELDGLNTTEIMPERYRAHHSAGVNRFRETGEGKLIGRVVNVDLLRRDGTEIPISLAFTASRSEEHDWFIAIIWARETYDQPASEAVNVRQDDREVHQNEEDANLEIRRVQQDRREVSQDRRDLDNVRQDARESSQNEEGTSLDARRMRQDERDELHEKRSAETRGTPE